MKYLQSFENYTSTPISKGAEIEMEKEKRDVENIKNEENLKELEEELEEEIEKKEVKKKKSKE